MKLAKFTSISIITALIFVIIPNQSARAATGPICYVKTGASGTGDSWVSAYPDLQTALADNNCSEIWVAQGTYYPDEGTGQTNNDRTSTFTLKSNVAIYGGFDGTEAARADRDWTTNTTTLSGDIDQVSGNSNNAYHVATGSGTDSTAILDGFTITAGNADAPVPPFPTPVGPDSKGGGMYSTNGNATLKNLILYKNNAIQLGGALYADAGFSTPGYSPTLDNILFDQNTSGKFGGAVYMIGVNNPGSIKNTTFKNNTAPSGGALYLFSSSPTLENVTFSYNTATGAPGAPLYTGGAIYNDSGSNPSITNATFIGNSADEEGGALYNVWATPTLNNVILWGNTAATNPEVANVLGATPVITNSIIQGSNGSGASWDTDLGTDNGGNLDADPKLAPLANNGGVTPTHGLLPGSAAIDKGANCPATDQRGVTRPQGAGCDIGAYEAGAFNVSDTTPKSGARLTSLSTIEVTFSEDALNDSSNKAANYIDNYILVEAGSNSSFDTSSCAGGVAYDDIEQIIINTTYINPNATLTLENPLEAGKYRLFICGTTSIWSVAGDELNDGLADSSVDFDISASASSLPETGFRHGRVTQLAAQPPAKAYIDTAMTLEIPKLGVSMPIVGVAQTGESWDVTWLGNSAGYLYGSAFPTWAGNTVITGHVWDAYNRPGAFAELKTLKYGDQVQIQAWGQTYTYEVRESKLVTTKNMDTVFQSEQYDWVTLVTCEFYNPFSGEYLFRRAVRAVLVSVK